MRMTALPLAALALSALLMLPTSAEAGGVGLFNGTGFHFGESLSAAGGTGARMNEGGGVELLLGSMDGRLHGRLRFAYNAVLDLGPVGADADPEAPRDEPRHSGTLSVGAKVELLPNLEQVFGLYLVADVGVSPLVTQLRTYFFADVGPGIRIRPVERFEIFAELAFLLRFEKAFAAGPMLFLGARVAFD